MLFTASGLRGLEWIKCNK